MGSGFHESAIEEVDGEGGGLMRVKAIDVLRDVREKLSDPARWTTGEYARDSAGAETDPCEDLAVKWCGQGAIYACGAAHGMPSLQKVLREESGTGSDWAKPLLDLLDVVAIRLGFNGFIDANDRGGREAVLRVIESAMADLASGHASTIRRRPSPRRSSVGTAPQLGPLPEESVAQWHAPQSKNPGGPDVSEQH